MIPRVSRLAPLLVLLGLSIPLSSRSAAADPVARIENHGGSVRLVHRDDDGLDVDLGGSGITDDDLADVALLTNVRVLRLKDCRIGDSGLAHVARITTLQRLFLDGTGVTDAGMPALAPLTGLEFLNLYGSAVGDAGLAHVGRLPALKTVVITATPVTPHGLTAVRDSNPGLQLIPDPFRQRERTAAALEVAQSAVAEAERELAEALPRAAAAALTLPGLKQEHAEAQAMHGEAKKRRDELLQRVKEARITTENAAKSVAQLRERAEALPADVALAKQVQEQSRLADAAAEVVPPLEQQAQEAEAAYKAAKKEDTRRFQRFAAAEAVSKSAAAAEKSLAAGRLAADSIRGEAAQADRSVANE